MNLKVFVLLLFIAQGLWAQAQMPAALMYDPSVGSISFGAGDVKAALEQNGYSVTNLSLGDPSGVAQSVRIILATQDAGIPGMPVVAGITNQGYAIQKVVEGSATNWWVIGSDAPGVMYGGLELAEAVKLANGLAGVTNRQTNPYMTQRGIKFNIPLDVRSPSYSDDSDSAQANITNVWELSFWEDYFDSMARHRYNLLSLWNLHPFPSMVRVPEYPNVALADVKKKAGALWDATLTGKNMYSTSWTLTTVKTMTMDEKIAFWRQVMQYAQDRGIQLYVFTWNIFVNGTEPSGYGITDKSTNVITTDYFRKSVKAMFNTYPLLAGIGVTVGENMGGLTSEQEEQWVWDSYGQGIADAVADSKNAASPYYAPNRVIRLVHRLHYAEPSAILPFFQGLPGVNDADSTLTFSTKYSVAHMLSSTKPQASINDLTTIPAGKKTFLTIRNDDMYTLRWGDPDFARAYITNIPQQEKIAGFYMGPDGYTWGREYVSTEPDSPRQLVMDKMEYYFSLFGRLSFDPTIPNSRFEAILAERFPEVASSNLFQGWASVSKVMPLITRFYWGSRDFDWYPEACWSLVGFQTVQDFITPTRKPMNGNQDGDRPLFMSVKEYVDGVAANGRLNPLEVADLFQQYADNGLTNVQSLNPGANKELRLTLGDIKAQAWLGLYYAEKIRGAVDLYRYQITGLTNHHASARSHLIAASNHWSQYAAVWSTQYIGQVLARMEMETPIDIAALQAAVNADIPPPLGATPLEALPWVEDFNLPDGTKTSAAPTSWTASRGGVFQVNAAGQLFINGAGGEGILETGEMDIGGQKVRISLSVSAAGGLDTGADPDYIRFYKIVDGGIPELVVPEIQGAFTGTNMLVGTNSMGSRLKLRVVTKVSATTEYYYFDDLKVESLTGSSSNFTLLTSASNGSISLNPAGGNYTSGTVVTVTAVPNSGYSFGSWSGDLSGTVNPTNITMDGHKSVTANFNLIPTVGTLIQHLDATISNSVTGSPVTQWADQSGNLNHAVPAAGSVLYPSTSRSASGLAGVDFGPAANSLQLFSSANSQAWLDFTGAASTNGGFAVLLALKCDELLTNNWNDVFGNASAVSGFGMRYSQYGAIQVYLGGASVDRKDNPVQAGNTVVFAFNYDAVAGSYAFWDSKNGSEVTKSVVATNFSKTAAVTLGRADSANRYFKGMVGEVKVFRIKLSSAQFQSERDALVTKWIIEPQLTGYDAWAATNNLGVALADDDGDGRPNLLEYAIGGDPKTGGDSNDPVIVRSGDSFDYSYQQRNDDPGLTYVLQSCTNLLSPVWSTMNTIVITNSTSRDYDQVTRPVPPNDSHLYIRLHVTSPE